MSLSPPSGGMETLYLIFLYSEEGSGGVTLDQQCRLASCWRTHQGYQVAPQARNEEMGVRQLQSYPRCDAELVKP